MMAAGKIIHNAQGSTLQGAVIDFDNRKNDHMHYVGLSGMRNLSSYSEFKYDYNMCIEFS